VGGHRLSAASQALLFGVTWVVGDNLVRVAISRSLRRIPRWELSGREIRARRCNPLFKLVNIETEFLRFVLNLHGHPFVVRLRLLDSTDPPDRFDQWFLTPAVAASFDVSITCPRAIHPACQADPQYLLIPCACHCRPLESPAGLYIPIILELPMEQHSLQVLRHRGPVFKVVRSFLSPPLLSG
jgi:hypothetical protein